MFWKHFIVNGFGTHDFCNLCQMFPFKRFEKLKNVYRESMLTDPISLPETLVSSLLLRWDLAKKCPSFGGDYR